ncbi:MAG: 2-oxo acid dehydrogenase subunit E2 [Polyangiaceae bacterium]
MRVPECNAQFSNDAILVHRRVDVSVAVSVAEGLLTPVVRDADKKSVLAISSEIRELAGRAKAKKLRPEEMANGTFSISNLGMYGVDALRRSSTRRRGRSSRWGQVVARAGGEGDAVVLGRKRSR